MVIAAVICEYNPFHNGHEYQLKKIREELKADYIICVMSGCFVQRGEPAVADKYIRANTALLSGADMVIELPVCFAAAASKDFAFGAVSVINALGCVDYLCFGSESADIGIINRITDILYVETPNYSQNIKKYLANGLSFAAARSKAVIDELSACSDIDTAVYKAVLSSSNDILAIEYILALKRLKSNIIPYAIKRVGMDYNAEAIDALNADGSCSYPSATALRNLLYDDQYKGEISSSYKRYMPESVYKLLSEGFNNYLPIFAGDFSSQISYFLINCYSEGHDLTEYGDISSDLSGRINALYAARQDFMDLCMAVSAKNIPLSRVKRAIFQSYLQIAKKDMEMFRKKGAAYAHVLGFRKDKRELFSIIRNRSKDCEHLFPLFTQVSEAKTLLKDNKYAKNMLKYDHKAYRLYSSILFNKFNKPFTAEESLKALIV